MKEKKPYVLTVENKKLTDILKFLAGFDELEELLWTHSRVSCGKYEKKQYSPICWYNTPNEHTEDFFQSCFADGYNDVRLELVTGPTDYDNIATIIFLNVKE